MKNKKAVYILLPLVAVIWGIIIYRIFSAAGDKNNSNTIQNNAMIKPLGSMAPDTFHIVANYRDPFLGKIPDQGRGVSKAPVAIKKPEKIVVPVNWPQIIYKGMIKNQKLNKQLGMVQISEHDHLLKPGDVVQGVKVMKLYKDSVEVEFQKEKKMVRKGN